MKKALVLGCDSRIFLSVIRSLGRGGVQVHVAWHKPDSPALRSRYIFKAHDLPPFSETDTAWRHALIDLMEREQFDLTIPCSDLETIAVQTNRAELEEHGRVYAISDHAFEALFDKFKTNELARSVGVRTPREVIVTNAEQAESALELFEMPVVLKPPRSFNAAAPEVVNDVRKVYSKDEYRQVIWTMLQSSAVSVQENFIGQGAGVELLLCKGEPLLVFQHMRVHEPLEGGPSCYRRGVRVWPELLEASLKIMRALDYTGVAMVEFKIDPKTRDWVLIEINARFWGSLPLAIASGADFPIALFRMLVEKRSSFPRKPRIGIHSRNLQLDLEWQLTNLSADRSDPTLATRPPRKVLCDLFVNLFLLRERNDTLTLDDPRPGIAEVRELLRRVFRRLHMRRRSSTVATEETV